MAMVDSETIMPPPPMVETIDTCKIEIMIDDALVKKIGHLVANHSDEALSVVRTWMSEKA